MAWIALSLDTTCEAVDWVWTLLADTAPRCELRLMAYTDETTNAVPDWDTPAASPWAFTIDLYLAEADAAQRSPIEQALASLIRTGMATPLRSVRLAHKPTVLRPLRYAIGDRFVVTTDSTLTTANPDSDSHQTIPLIIQPSLSFGSGLHPATQLSLQLLERHLKKNMATLDLGCGSGILSIAMAKLGAQVLAIDNDQQSVQATRSAVQSNGVMEQVQVLRASLGKGSELGHWMGHSEHWNDAETTAQPIIKIEAQEQFDLISANILARVHIDLAVDYQRSLRPGGQLVTAGYTQDYADDIATALADVGFQIGDRLVLGDWVATVFCLQTGLQGLSGEGEMAYREASSD
jgi:ribosomal protein L11 methyltransferase